MSFQVNRKLIVIFVLFTLIHSNLSARPERWEEERLSKIRQIVYSGVSNLTSQLMAMRDELSGREEPVQKVSKSMSGHLLESWMKIVNGEDVDKPNEMDYAFAQTMESMNETLPAVIQELYLATGTMSRQDAEPTFYQGTLGFISAAVFGVVFYEMVRSLPSVIRRASNWIHDTQDELASAVDKFLHNHPRVLNTTNGTEIDMYRDMAWNKTYFKNVVVSPDYVKNLFRI